MECHVIEKSVEELLIDAYKAQVSTYVRLLEVKDAQVASLELRVEDLEYELERATRKLNELDGSFGDKIRKLRLEKNLTMKELGKRVGLTESAIGMIERGLRKPSYAKLIDISRFFKVDVESLTSESHNSTGLTDKEREEIAKLTEEIMKTRAFGILDASKENTTTENSDVDYNESGVLFFKGTEVKID